MSQIPPLSTGNQASDMDVLCASIDRVARKIRAIADAVQNLNQNRVQLENKIEDAQKRIQHILSRLPEQSDGRQLNLLGQVVAPTIPEDDNEPTTH